MNRHITDTHRALIHMPEDALFASAGAVRRRTFGDAVELCAIINARSGHCSMDCHFCAQSVCYDTGAPVFPLLSAQELHERLAILAPYPIRRVGIVTSGGALSADDVDALTHVFADCNTQERWHGRLCASLGRLEAQSLQRLHEAGLVRYHHNLESSETFYPHICSTQQWSQRKDTVTRAHEVGMSVCCGGIFGLGESWDDRISFALSLKEMGVRHVPINFLHPQKGTPLAGKAPLDAAEALRIIAIFRHILPEATLRVCGGAQRVLHERRHHIFDAGANALMVGDYLTTRGKAVEEDILMIKAVGLKVYV